MGLSSNDSAITIPWPASEQQLTEWRCATWVARAKTYGAEWQK